MAKFADRNGIARLLGKIKTLLAGKQDTLVSGTNIKTVNNTSLLGSGNISVNAHQTLTDVTANEYVGEDGAWSLYWDGDGETSYIANVPVLYGTCSTAASNTTKQVSCGNATGKTVYEDGTVLNVYFSTANTAAGPIYLKVGQNTGSVYVHGSITGSSNPLLWSAGTMLTFVRSGSIWRYVGSDAASPSAQTYTASWIATSSAANNVKLTGSLILPAGTYVVVANLPNTSTWMAVQLYGVANYYGHGQALQNGTWIITLTQETEIYLRTASSTSCTYSYTERGRLTAVRIAGVGTSGARFERKTSGLGVTFTAESGFAITVAEEFSDGGLYHCKFYVTKTSAWTAWANVKIGSATGLRGAIVCNDALYGSVNSVSNNIWVVPRAAFSANQSVEAEVIGFLA